MTSQDEIARLMTITASERALEINTETRAWIAAAEGRGAFTLVEDQAFWAERGVHTGLDLELENVASAISDSYKEHYGFRPNMATYSTMSLAQMEEELSCLMGKDQDEQGAECYPEDEAAEEDAFWDAEAALNVSEDAMWRLQDNLEGVRV